MWPFSNPIDPNIYNVQNFWPKISIVTPSYNQGQFIEETILSILNQNYPNLEYIIIDGGSTDNTVEIIKKYENRITYWISEKDEGQTDAILKGFKKSSGEWINWLNSDDLLLPNALFDVANKIISSQKETNVLIFSTETFIDNQIIGVSKAKKPTTLASFFQEKDYPVIPQPSTFIRNHTIYPEKEYHYVMDWTLYINFILKYGNCFENHDAIIAKFRLHDNSKTNSYQRLFDFEAIKYLEKTFDQSYPISAQIKYKISVIKLRHLLEKFSKSQPWKILKILSIFAKNHPEILKNRIFLGAIKKNLKNSLL